MSFDEPSPEKSALQVGLRAWLGLVAVAGLGFGSLLVWERSQGPVRRVIAGVGYVYAQPEFFDLVHTPDDDEILRRADRINCFNGKMDDAGLASLARRANPRRLDLSNSQVTDAGMASLPKMDRIEHLDLGAVRIGEASVPILKQMTSLRSVSLYDTQIPVEGLQELGKSLPETIIFGTSQPPAPGERPAPEIPANLRFRGPS